MALELPISSPALASRERADARRNRERILCAAARLIEANGLEAVSMDDVAAEAGVGKGTLYRRFGDRATLVRALVDEEETAFQESLLRGAPPLGPGAPPLERLHAFGDAITGFYDRHAGFIAEAERTMPGSRFDHPVFVAYRLHVGVLVGQILGPDDPRRGPITDALLATLTADLFLHRRAARGESVDEIRAAWHVIADQLCAPA